MVRHDTKSELYDKLEDHADNILRYSRKYLPIAARICLVGTFIEDGFRMWYQWGEQRDYINHSWGCGRFIAALFVFLNLVIQIGASFCILSIAYSILWDAKFLARSLALIGAVMLLIAEAKQEARSLFVGVPTMENVQNNPRNLIQLSGRIMLVLMFLSLLKFSSKPLEVVKNIIGGAFMACITVGYRTKANSLMLVIWLFIINISMHDFWRHRTGSIMYDYKKFDFFQTLSTMGGLLMLVSIGPGGVSLDERKKMY